ncbi:MAG TPA: hypothetical protein VH413_20205 [Verrucomicrobiae bacterium]|jgi:hypothetical protein|nr:hypothetical protein [Verrucomicrobiae bacterium]
MRIHLVFRHVKNLFVVCAVATLITACHKNAGGTSGSAEQPTPPPPTVEIPAGSPSNALTGEVNSDLTRQLRSFIRQKARFPVDLDELAQSRSMQLPAPPAGKHWVIDVQTTEVKAVDSAAH